MLWIWTTFQVVEILKSKNLSRPLPKVPKFAPPIVDLDDPPVDVEPIQTVHPIQTDPPPAKTPRKPYPSESFERPSNLVLDESYAWRMFKGLITDNEVNSCYNMSVKEFERSGIHDLFKVCLIRPCVLSFKFSNKMSNFPSSIHRLCQNFTQRPARLRSSL